MTYPIIFDCIYFERLMFMFGIVPFKKMSDMMNVFDDDFWKNNDNFGLSTISSCRTDIKENEKEYIVEAELPGFKKEDITLDISDDVLTLKAEHKNENKEEKDGKYIRRERSYCSYQRSFVLEGIDSEKIDAKYENGILSLVMPKVVTPTVPTRRLEIK